MDRPAADPAPHPLVRRPASRCLSARRTRPSPEPGGSGPFRAAPLWPLVLGLVLAGCLGSGPSSSNTPEEMLEAVAGPRVLAAASDVQGCGETWQGYSLWLRWRMPPPALDSFLATGWTPVPNGEVGEAFALPDGYDCFGPPWSPSLRAPVYTGRFPNPWGTGDHALLADTATGTVYFHGLAP